MDKDALPITYVTSDELVDYASALPKVLNRSKMLEDLVKEYGILEKMNVIDPIATNELQLSEFHSKSYLNALKSRDPDLHEKHHLEYDCPVFESMFEAVCTIAGGSLAAALEIADEYSRVAVHWHGGWHHGKPDEAAGFCYLNDCVLVLRQWAHVYDRILYIDLDLHHGDEVQRAFYHTDKVVTYSVHKFETGFYPGTGGLTEIGAGKGLGYTVNVPLLSGADDETLNLVIDETLFDLMDRYKPQAILLQCGVDGVAGDPHQAFNYTPGGLSSVLRKVLSRDLPTLLLGGGGYHIANAARTWTRITADILGVDINNDIPEHSFFCEYGPSFELKISPLTLANKNTDEYIKDVCDNIKKNLNLIR